jgi:hypothetical protein
MMMRVLFVAFLVLLSALDCCGSVAPGVNPENPYEVVFRSFSKRGTISLPIDEESAATEKKGDGDDESLAEALNALFGQTEDVFTDRSYFFELFELRFPESGENQFQRERLRGQSRKNFIISTDLSGHTSFKLLIDLDDAQDKADKEAVTRCVEAIFQDKSGQLEQIKDYYKRLLSGNNLKSFICALDPSVFFSKRSALAQSLLSDKEDKFPEEATGLKEIYGRLLGRLSELETKIATPHALCFSFLGGVVGIVGGSLALAYNASTSSLTLSDVTQTDEYITVTSVNDTEVFNTTDVSEEVRADYRSTTASNLQYTLGTGMLLGGMLSAYKFVHDITFWHFSPKTSYGLEWLAFYITAYPEESRTGAIAMAPGILEKALQKQTWFMGRNKNKFLTVVMNEIDKSSL